LVEGWSGKIGFDNFFKLADDRRFINSIYVLASLSGFGVAFQVVLGTAVAVGLQKIVSNWKVARGLFLIPYAVPHTAVALIWLSIFTPTLSPINSFFEVFGITVPAMLTTENGAIAAIVIADTWATYPFVMLLILAALNGISGDLDEAAALDGANRMKTFFYITLPLLMPALLMVTLFRFIDSLKHFPLIFVMTKGGPGRSTQVTNFYAYVQTFQNSNVAYGASIAVFLFVFAAIVSFYVARLNSRISDA
jgi:multiple sugar transport system permease protein